MRRCMLCSAVLAAALLLAGCGLLGGPFKDAEAVVSDVIMDILNAFEDTKESYTATYYPDGVDAGLFTYRSDVNGTFEFEWDEPSGFVTRRFEGYTAPDSGWTIYGNVGSGSAGPGHYNGDVFVLAADGGSEAFYFSIEMSLDYVAEGESSFNITISPMALQAEDYLETAVQNHELMLQVRGEAIAAAAP